jgi:sRNA-binding regulator protein Hfq
MLRRSASDFNATSKDASADPGNRKPSRAPSGSAVRPPMQKKPAPPDQTNAENFYYLKQMQSKTPMVIVLKDGETLRGVIEWYDKASIKVNRDDAPNLLIFKDNIKYMYKAG